MLGYVRQKEVVVALVTGCGDLLFLRLHSLSAFFAFTQKCLRYSTPMPARYLWFSSVSK